MGVVVGEARGGEEDDDGQEGQGYEEKEGVKGKGEKGKVDIRIPEKAIAEAAKVVKGVLEKKVELEPEGKGFWD